MKEMPQRIEVDFSAEPLELGAFYRTLFTEPGLAVYVIRVEPDGSFRFEDANPGVAKLAIGAIENIKESAPRDCLPTEVADCIETHLRECLASRQSVAYERSLDLAGGRVFLKTRLMPVATGTAPIRHVIGLTRDITYEKEMVGLAEQNEALLQGLSAALPSAIYLFNIKNRTIRFLGGQVSKVRHDWRKQAEDAGSQAGAIFTHPDDLPKLEARVGELAKLRDGEVSEIEFRMLGPSGDYRRFECRETVFNRDAEGGVEHILGISEDVSEQDRMQEEVRNLSDRLLTLQTDERRRIAEDLHDSTAQHLTAAGLALTRIPISLSQPEGRSSILRALDDARHSLGEATREIRVLAYLLHPPLVEDLGFGEAIRTFAAGFGSRVGLNVETRIDPEARTIAGETALHLFRICQEALANVYRHARATKVSIKFELTETDLVLSVVDDGVGFDPSKLEGEVPAGVGLLGMRERMKRLGGSLTLTCGEHGTQLRATAPRSRDDGRSAE